MTYDNIEKAIYLLVGCPELADGSLMDPSAKPSSLLFVSLLSPTVAFPPELCR